MGWWSDLMDGARQHRNAVTKRQEQRQETAVALAQAHEGGHSDRTYTRQSGRVASAQATGVDPGVATAQAFAQMGASLGGDVAPSIGAAYGEGVTGQSTAAGSPVATSGGSTSTYLIGALVLTAILGGAYVVTR